MQRAHSVVVLCAHPPAPAEDPELASKEKQRRADSALDGAPSQVAPRRPSRNAIVAEIADALGESTGPTRHALHTLLRHHGEAFLREHLAKAREVQASGGMLTLDGSRPRTFCGTFLFLAKQTIGIKAWRVLFPFTKKKRRRKSERDDQRPEPCDVA